MLAPTASDGRAARPGVSHPRSRRRVGRRGAGHHPPGRRHRRPAAGAKNRDRPCPSSARQPSCASAPCCRWHRWRRCLATSGRGRGGGGETPPPPCRRRAMPRRRHHSTTVEHRHHRGRRRAGRGRERVGVQQEPTPPPPRAPRPPPRPRPPRASRCRRRRASAAPIPGAHPHARDQDTADATVTLAGVDGKTVYALGPTLATVALVKTAAADVDPAAGGWMVQLEMRGGETASTSSTRSRRCLPGAPDPGGPRSARRRARLGRPSAPSISSPATGRPDHDQRRLQRVGGQGPGARAALRLAAGRARAPDVQTVSATLAKTRCGGRRRRIAGLVLVPCT